MNDPTNGTPLPNSGDDGGDESVDRELRAAFGELRDATSHLDTLAARRKITDPAPAMGEGRRRSLPSLAGMLVAVVAVAGIGFALSRIDAPSQQVETADPPPTEASDDVATDDDTSESTDPPGTTSETTGDDQTTATGAGGEEENAATGDTGTDETTPDEPVELDYDESLTWSVVLVAPDDTLNVRSGPGIGNRVVAELAPNESSLIAGTDTATVGDGLWRQVGRPDDGLALGWVNERFLAAEPVGYGAADTEAMLAAAESAVAWLGGDQPAPGPATWLSPTGVGIGGIGVYADAAFPTEWVPAANLQTRQGWSTPVDVTPDALAGQCPDCLVSPLDFVKIPPPDRAYSLVPDEDLLDGGQDAGGPMFRNGPVGRLDAMPHVTVDVPPSAEGELDWQRIHLFFDWRTGEPKLHTIYTWGWTP